MQFLCELSGKRGYLHLFDQLFSGCSRRFRSRALYKCLQIFRCDTFSIRRNYLHQINAHLSGHLFDFGRSAVFKLLLYAAFRLAYACTPLEYRRSQRLSEDKVMKKQEVSDNV